MRRTLLALMIIAGAVGGMPIPVGPGLPVQAVDREDLDLARFDKVSQYPDHAKILELMKTAALRREDQHRLAIIAIDLHFHVMPEDGAEPFVIFGLHRSLDYS